MIAKKTRTELRRNYIGNSTKHKRLNETSNFIFINLVIKEIAYYSY